MNNRPISAAVGLLLLASFAGACKSKPQAKEQAQASTAKAPVAQQPADAAVKATEPAAALPPALQAALEPIEAQIVSDDQLTRFHGHDAMKALVAKNANDVALANALLAERDFRIAEYGLDMWKEMGSSHEGFLVAMRRALVHPSDQLRNAAANIFWMEDRKPVMSELQKLLTDDSCLVRVQARHVLVRHDSPQPEVLQATMAALDDEECPVVQAWGLQKFTRNGVSWPADDAKLVGRLETMAGGSPYYQLRCLALTALAKMKVANAEALIGKAFAIPAQTALDTDYLDRSASEPSLITENALQEGTMAECAAHAWAVLHDLKAPEEPRAMVGEMWHEAAAKGAAAKPPKKLCTRADDCRKGQYCIAYSCQSLKQAESAYWSFRKLDKCSHEDAEAHTRNADTSAEIASGLATHSLATNDLPIDLQEAGRKAFERHEQAIAQLSCADE